MIIILIYIQDSIRGTEGGRGSAYMCIGPSKYLQKIMTLGLHLQNISKKLQHLASLY